MSERRHPAKANLSEVAALDLNESGPVPARQRFKIFLTTPFREPVFLPRLDDCDHIKRTSQYGAAGAQTFPDPA